MAALGAFALTAGDASAGTTCGGVVSQDTVLTQDLDCSAGGFQSALRIQGDVTLDMNGHKLIGPGGRTGIRIAGQSGSTVTNGTIKKFQTGVRISGSEGVTVRRLRLGKLEEGVLSVNSTEGLIRKSHVEATTGIFLTGAEDSLNEISANELVGGEQAILHTGGESATVRDNVIRKPGTRGLAVQATEQDTIVGNELTKVEGHGIEVGDSSNLIEVSGNEVTRSRRSGIRFEGGGLIVENRVTRSGDHGILVKSDSPDIVENVANRNGKLGIKSESSDGGDNRARHNGNHDQCSPSSLCD